MNNRDKEELENALLGFFIIVILFCIGAMLESAERQIMNF